MAKSGTDRQVTGYRARSSLKLAALDDEYNFLRRAKGIVDLCAAPGSWSQLARERSSGAIVAVDVQKIAPIEGVTILQGDITMKTTEDAIVAAVSSVDVVLCDGAAEVTGLHDLDQVLHAQLLHSAVSLTRRLLNPDGAFIAKIFGCPDLLKSQLRLLFRNVDVVKPSASRERSGEAFIVCRGFEPRSVCERYLESGDLSFYDRLSAVEEDGLK